jgi:hypothetical protein
MSKNIMKADISYVILACYADKGMKSYGSKGLIVFNQYRLFDYQINTINKYHQSKNHEIIILCNFDTAKIIKTMNGKARIEPLDENTNPIYHGCSIAKNKKIVFIDYGLVFNKYCLSEIDFSGESQVLCCKKDTDKLEIGCVTKDENVEHMFFGVQHNKFCNLFYICEHDKDMILTNKQYHAYNLLYFEIINYLVSNGSTVKSRITNNKNFTFFNNMRQKNGINKFIKSN